MKKTNTEVKGNRPDGVYIRYKNTSDKAIPDSFTGTLILPYSYSDLIPELQARNSSLLSMLHILGILIEEEIIVGEVKVQHTPTSNTTTTKPNQYIPISKTTDDQKIDAYCGMPGVTDAIKGTATKIVEARETNIPIQTADENKEENSLSINERYVKEMLEEEKHYISQQEIKLLKDKVLSNIVASPDRRWKRAWEQLESALDRIDLMYYHIQQEDLQKIHEFNHDYEKVIRDYQKKQEDK